MWSYTYSETVADATITENIEAVVAEIDRNPAIRRVRLLLRASRPPAKVPRLQNPPRLRPPPPPAPRRCYRPQAHRASKDSGGDDAYAH
jgi:hypothetical protein